MAQILVASQADHSLTDEMALELLDGGGMVVATLAEAYFRV
jgi:hypothetical protein